MTDHVSLLRQARALLAQISRGTDVPAVYQAVHIADTNLHWAAWHLGAVEEILPEIESTEAGPDGAPDGS